MPRFLVRPEDILGDGFALVGSEARHAALVLRKKPGDTIDLFDGKDLSYRGKIRSVSEDRVEGIILEKQQEKNSAACELTLYQALIKGPKWDWLVEKACEIGVYRLVPLITSRTIIKPSRDSALDRWKRIAVAASKQCGRNNVMEIVPPTPFTVAISRLPKTGIALIPWEKEEKLTIRAALSSHPASSVSAGIFIGPEGGWENQEVELAKRDGVIPVTLGPTLLRAETAGLVASTLVLAELGTDL